jgi:Outer membrane receptor for ferrienterochelin and colicins
LGARLVKNFDKVSMNISGEAKVASELPYGNKDDEIYWVVGDTLYLNDDLYDPLEMSKNQLRTNIYYRINKLNEFSVFYNYEEGKGYAMGSLGPIYNRGLKRHQYGFRFNNNNHFFRFLRTNQIADAAFRLSLGLTQVIFRNSDDTSLSWQEALDGFEEYGLGWWLKYNSDDYIVDYQYNNKLTDRLNLVAGLDYEFKDPDTDRTSINDQGVSPITGSPGGKDIHEFRYGIYGQVDLLINNEYTINTSVRFDNHEYYGNSISPRASIVRKNFLNGNLKLIAGTGFKAPTLLERNVHAGQRNIANGKAGDPDPILGGIYPQDG